MYDDLTHDEVDAELNRLDRELTKHENLRLHYAALFDREVSLYASVDQNDDARWHYAIRLRYHRGAIAYIKTRMTWLLGLQPLT